MITEEKPAVRRRTRKEDLALLYKVLRRMARRNRGRIPNPTIREIQEAGVDLKSYRITILAQALEHEGKLDRDWRIK